MEIEVDPECAELLWTPQPVEMADLDDPGQELIIGDRIARPASS